VSDSDLHTRGIAQGSFSLAGGQSGGLLRLLLLDHLLHARDVTLHYIRDVAWSEVGYTIFYCSVYRIVNCIVSRLQFSDSIQSLNH
jgi:hypothetical protein